MSSSPSVAASLSNYARKSLAILSLSKAEPVARLAGREGVSRQFVYRQKQKAAEALDEAFAAKSDDVIFHLPVTEAWLNQLTLALILICRSSFRGVKELLRDLFNIPISVGTIHNRLRSAAAQACAINRSQNLSAIRVGLHDEIFQGSMPVLAGVDAASTYCYLLADAEHRDADTWAVHLLDANAQGFDPDHTIADAGQGLRSGQKAALGDTPCHGDVFHIQKQCESLANVLARVAMGATSRRKALDMKMDAAKENSCGNTLSAPLTLARQTEKQASQLARDVKTLVHWLTHDILALAGPVLAERQVLFDFIVAELRHREHLDPPRIRPVRTALEKQRDDLLAFAGVLDEKLGGIAQDCDAPLYLVRDVLFAATEISIIERLLAALELIAQETWREIPACRRRRGRCDEKHSTRQFARRKPQLAAAQLFLPPPSIGRALSQPVAVLPQSPHLPSQPASRASGQKPERIDDRTKPSALARTPGVHAVSTPLS